MQTPSRCCCVKSHLTQSYKEAIIPVYFEAIGLPAPLQNNKTGKRKRGGAAAEIKDEPAFSKELSDAWLKDLAYMKSAKGFLAILEALMKLLRVLGVSDRIVQPKDVGGAPYIDCTFGHFALVCAIIRAVFEKASGLKAKRRSGLAGGIFIEFSAEVRRCHEFLPADNLPHRGLRLLDGHDTERASLDDAVDVESDVLEEEDLDMAALDGDLVDAMDDMGV